ncbi:kelch-like protein 26 isoform A [Patagioenas fasciata monilis]|uniref:Kelch-like protein 26 isoform A n=1 Tax=Patagioenas fasciata monilis TaxID=372326 RepID=A0A1V4KQI1_PATFA|nr:kelch-like protein 26 isoform A [Patagioenas fasciata monilis]
MLRGKKREHLTFTSLPGDTENVSASSNTSQSEHDHGEMQAGKMRCGRRGMRLCVRLRDVPPSACHFAPEHRLFTASLPARPGITTLHLTPWTGKLSRMADKNSTLKCTFSAPGHSTTLLQGLASLRAQAQLLDVILTINNEVFQVHKVVLAACSDYFRAMFTGGMREASQDVIELKGVSAKGLKHIIDFAYSAEVTLDLDCIQDVLGAAVFLQMVPVVELCEEFLKSAMSVETCLNIGQMATTFSLASLKESVDAFTFRHFLQISEEEDFLHLPLERLVFFLQSNKLKSCSEIDLFRAAVRWLQYDQTRRASASQVLCHIRFPLMKSSELVDSVQTLDIMVEDVLCRQYLLEAFNYQILPFRQHEMQSPRTTIRSDVLSLVTFGGTPYTDNDRTVSCKVYCLPDAGGRQFKELTEMEVGSSHSCVAVLDNFVYIVGGQHLQYRSGEGAVDICYRYDPHLNQWLRIQAMQESRIQFQLNVLRGMVYATGGRNRSGSLASVEKYCPKTNEWTYVCSLKRRTWGHAGATVGDKLYISGGYGISVEDKKALHCYDPAVDQWEFKTPMNEPRVLHAMVSANKKIYALGGRMDHVDRCFDVLAVEYYVPETDQWTTVSPMRAGGTLIPAPPVSFGSSSPDHAAVPRPLLTLCAAVPEVLPSPVHPEPAALKPW